MVESSWYLLSVPPLSPVETPTTPPSLQHHQPPQPPQPYPYPSTSRQGCGGVGEGALPGCSQGTAEGSLHPPASTCDNKRTRIAPRHILLAVRNDEELNMLLAQVVISEGGVLPNIQDALMPKKTKGSSKDDSVAKDVQSQEF